QVIHHALADAGGDKLMRPLNVAGSSQIDTCLQNVESISNFAVEKRNARLLGWIICSQFPQLSNMAVNLSRGSLIRLEVNIQSRDDIASLAGLRVFQRGKSHFELVEDLVCMPDPLVIVDQGARRGVRE